jgi:hypothetical protein
MVGYFGGVMDLETEIYQMVRVHRVGYAGGPLYSLQMPSIRDVAALYHRLGVRALPPECSDDIWARVLKRVQDNMAALRAAADTLNYGWDRPAVVASSNGEGNKMTTSSASASASASVKPKVIDTSVLATAGAERIRKMTFAEVEAECARLGLDVTLHPTNKGISAMRMRNALYHNLVASTASGQKDAA